MNSVRQLHSRYKRSYVNVLLWNRNRIIRIGANRSNAIRVHRTTVTFKQTERETKVIFDIAQYVSTAIAHKYTHAQFICLRLMQLNQCVCASWRAH